MTTPEHQALLDDLISHLDDAATHVKALIAERDALKAELDAIKQGAGGPVGHVYTMEPCIPGEHVRYHAQMTAKVPAGTKLYTRPCVSLTDEKVKELICEHFVTGENLFNEVHQDYRFRSLGTATNVWGADLLKFARAIEAHIKGAKG